VAPGPGKRVSRREKCGERAENGGKKGSFGDGRGMMGAGTILRLGMVKEPCIIPIS